MKQSPDDWAPLTQKGAPHAGWRPFKYGLIWAAISVAVVVLLATLHGLFLGFHPAPIYGSYGPGLNAAATMVVFVLVFRRPTRGRDWLRGRFLRKSGGEAV